jgi:serine/threonine-protein kinase
MSTDATVRLDQTLRSPSERSVGPYRIVARLGVGGMARVFLALSEAREFRKLLVLKVLREELASDEYRRMFESEAQICARFNHPNVVQTYAVGEEATAWC